MKKILLSTALSLSCLALISCGGGGSSSSPSTNAAPAALQPLAATNSPTAADHFARLNQVRAASGLAPVAWNTKLEAAALNHAAWSNSQKVISHEETPGTPGFTGAFVQDRATAVGAPYSNYISETMAAVDSSQQTAISEMDRLFQSAAHRVYLLAPEFQLAASAIVGFSATTVLASDDSKRLATVNAIFYPYQNQAGVLAEYDPAWSKFPSTPYTEKTGTPISLTRYFFSKMQLHDFTMKEEITGNVVEMYPLDTKSYLAAIVVYPKAPLKSGTSYLYNFSATVDSLQINQTIKFTTQ